MFGHPKATLTLSKLYGLSYYPLVNRRRYFMVYENLRFSDCSFAPVTIFKTEISGFFILNTGQIWDNLASENC